MMRKDKNDSNIANCALLKFARKVSNIICRIGNRLHISIRVIQIQLISLNGRRLKAINLGYIQTHYINLHDRLDRRTSTEKELKRVGISHFSRFDAVLDEVGSIGCAKSHLKLIERASEDSLSSILIFEDDIKFLCTGFQLEQCIEDFFSSPNADVLCIGNVTSGDLEKFSRYLLRTKDTQTASAYILKSHIFEDMKITIKQGISLMENGDFQNGAIDQIWKSLQNRYVFVVPKRKMLVQRKSFSDIEGRIVNYLN
jgi:glycosyl transferase, family 25